MKTDQKTDSKLQKNTISLAGEFAVLSQLALRGIDANLTLGNTKSVDILASNPATGSMFRIEVKTSKITSTKMPNTLSWIMGSKHEKIIDPNLYYCFVTIHLKTNSFRFFVVPSREVAGYVTASHSHWLEKGNVVDNVIRNFRITADEGTLEVPTPLASKYENAWLYFTN